MNFDAWIRRTGKRIRRGKIRQAQLTNAQIREVLEGALVELEEALVNEGRVEIQHFAVLEIQRTEVRSTRLRTTTPEGLLRYVRTPSTRTRFVFKPSKRLRKRVKGGVE
jgi:nucleoid DNA-binding protein